MGVIRSTAHISHGSRCGLASHLVTQRAFCNYCRLLRTLCDDSAPKCSTCDRFRSRRIPSRVIVGRVTVTGCQAIVGSSPCRGTMVCMDQCFDYDSLVTHCAAKSV